MLSDAQKKQLAAELPREAVRERSQGGQRLSYVESWWTIARANDVFGADGWSYEVRGTRILADYERDGNSGKNRVVIYEATVRVCAIGCFREDVGIGVCDAPATNPAQGLEKAAKEAVSDALKRCLRTFGMSFGLALYDKAQEHVGLSFEAQALLAEVDALQAGAGGAWLERTRAARDALPDAERAEVDRALAARRSALAVAASAKAAEVVEAAKDPAVAHALGLAAPSAAPPGAALAAAQPKPRPPPDLAAGITKINSVGPADLLRLGVHVVAAPEPERAVLAAAYTARWCALLREMDQATVATVATKLDGLPAELKAAPGWEPVRELLLATPGCAPDDAVLPTPEEMEPSAAGAIAAFRAEVPALELPGEGVALWIRHRARLAKLPEPDRKAAWELICKRVEDVGKMRNAHVWLKRAVDEEDARRASPDNHSFT